MKMNNSGFTLIELMIVLAIVGILVSMANAFYTSQYGKELPSRTYTTHPAYPQAQSGPEMKCIDGFKFLFTSSGNATQVFDNGIAVRCN